MEKLWTVVPKLIVAGQIEKVKNKDQVPFLSKKSKVPAKKVRISLNIRAIKVRI